MLRSALATVLVLSFTPAFAIELVPPSALNATFFDEKPVTTTDSKGRASQIIFAPAGTLVRTTANGRSSEGVWRLSEDGFCMQSATAKRESCYIVLKKDDGSYSALKRPTQGFIWTR